MGDFNAHLAGYSPYSTSGKSMKLQTFMRKEVKMSGLALLSVFERLGGCRPSRAERSPILTMEFTLWRLLVALPWTKD